MTAAFTLFDLRNFATTQPLRMLLPLALVVVFGATVPLSGAPIVIGALMAAVTASYYFQGDERGLLDTLYAITPISRCSVVVGRYISMLVLAAISVGLGAATAFIAAAIRHESLSWPVTATMLLAAFGIVTVAFAVQLPWFFALGFTRGRPMVYVPVGVIAVAAFVASQTGLRHGSVRLASFSDPSALATAMVLILGAAALVASATVAVRLYRKRAL